MMSGVDDEDIKKKIRVFIEPEAKKHHGRAIHRDEATSCGLAIENWNTRDGKWKTLYELYRRTKNYTDTRVVKCIEHKDDSFAVPASAPSDGARQ